MSDRVVSVDVVAGVVSGKVEIPALAFTGDGFELVLKRWGMSMFRSHMVD